MAATPPAMHGTLARQLAALWDTATPQAVEELLENARRAAGNASLDPRLRTVLSGLGALLAGVGSRYEEADRELERRTRDLALAADRLGEQLALIDTLVESIPIPIFVKDRERRYVRVNRAYCELFGLRPERLLGRTVEESGASPVHGVHTETDRRVLATGTGTSYEFRLQLRDGREIDCVTSKAVLTNGRGEITGLVGTLIDISDQKEATRALLQAKETAESASRMKGEFLANMSHEIRTPMNGIIGMTDIVLDTRLEPDQREYLGIVKASATALLAILNDILDFSKIEAGGLSVERTSFDLAQLLSQALLPVTPRAAERGIALRLARLPGLPARVVGDPGRLRQVLDNLLGNAVKFTEVGEVVLTAGPAGDPVAPTPLVWLRFMVRDTGIGIPQRRQAHIFAPFSQEDGSITRRFGGTGLGLAITRRLCELMGGRITMTSEPGRGSEFVVELPFEIDPQAASARSEAYREALAQADRQTVEIIAQPFLRELPREMAALRRAIDEQDLATLARRAHSMKGLLLAFAAQPAAALAERLQHVAERPAFERGQADACLAALHDEIELLAPHLQAVGQRLS